MSVQSTVGGREVSRVGASSSVPVGGPRLLARSATSRHAPRYASVAVRCFGVAALLSIVLLAGGDRVAAGVSVALGGTILLLAFDRRNWLSLRNFYLVYTTALFALGVPLFKLAPQPLFRDLLVYILAFLVGYASLSPRAPADGGGHQRPPSRGAASAERVYRMEELLLFFVCANVLALAVKLSFYGLGSFYGGQALVDQFSTYGTASIGGGITQIVNFFLRYTSIAAVVVYVQACVAAGISMRYRYPLMLLVGLPILTLARSDALIGAGLLLVIYSVERRLTASRSLPAGGHEPAPRVGRAPANRKRRSLALTATMVIAFLAALAIGGLRQSRIMPHTNNASPVGRTVPLLQSEFTPIQAYAEIKDNAELLGRPYGATIVWPLLFKVVPRGLFPGKPNNSGAYYMSTVRPREFAAGYALPPTLFGDAYLNFGFAGAVLACLILGAVSARLDVAYKKPRVSRLAWFLILYANLYAVLRSPLSESLAALLLTAAAWWVIQQFIFGPRARTPQTLYPGRWTTASDHAG